MPASSCEDLQDEDISSNQASKCKEKNRMENELTIFGVTTAMHHEGHANREFRKEFGIGGILVAIKERAKVCKSCSPSLCAVAVCDVRSHEDCLDVENTLVFLQVRKFSWMQRFF